MGFEVHSVMSVGLCSCAHGGGSDSAGFGQSCIRLQDQVEHGFRARLSWDVRVWEDEHTTPWGILPHAPINAQIVDRSNALASGADFACATCSASAADGYA